MSLFVAPKYQPQDASGNIYPLGSLEFFENGTLTPLAVYNDEGLTSSAGVSLALDAAGAVGPFYTPGRKYKVRLKNAAGTIIWTADARWGASYASVTSTINQIASNPLYYGALGDGVADETAAVQAAIDNATGVVDLLGLTYKCDDAILLTTAHNDLVIQNGTINCATGSPDYAFEVEGTLGGQIALTANAAAGATQLSLVTTGLTAGDYIALGDSTDFGVSANTREILRIKTIDSGVLLTLETKTVSAYTTAAAAYVTKITPVTNIRFKNVKMIGAGVYASVTKGLRVNDCDIDNASTFGVDLDGWNIGAKVDDNDITDSTTYGIRSRGPSLATRIVQNNINKCTFGVSIGEGNNGQGKDTLVAGNHIDGCTSYGIYCRSSEHEPRIGENYVDSTTDSAGLDGIYCAARGAKIYKNRIDGVFDNGISVDPVDSPRYAIEGNSVNNALLYGILVAGTGVTINSVSVCNNHVVAAGSGAIIVQTVTVTACQCRGNVATSSTINITSSVNGAVVAGNQVSGTGAYISCSATKGAIYGNSVTGVASVGIYCSGTGDTVYGNTVTTTGVTAISATGTLNIDISSNNLTCTGTGTAGAISVAPSDDGAMMLIASNMIYNTNGGAAYGIGIVPGAPITISDVVLSGNRIRMGGGSGSYGIYIAVNTAETADKLAVNGNLVRGAVQSFYFNGELEGATVSGNNFTNTGVGSPVVEFAGITAGDIVNVAICSNVLLGGTYSVTLSNNTNACIIDGNIRKGYATGTESLGTALAVASSDNDA